MIVIDRVRRIVRSWLKQLARFLNHISNGRITPNQITLVSTLAHGLVAWAIIKGQLGLAAAGLVLFGLMDALDGELARLQDRQSSLGIVLDATADRVKETLIYSGIAVYLARTENEIWLILVVLALGLSVSLSYIKAKGEAVLSSQTEVKLDPQALNRFLGGDTLMQFDVRMAVIVVGLVFDILLLAVGLIAAMSLFSIASRYAELMHTLEKE